MTVATRVPQGRLFSPHALIWMAEHAIDPMLALAVGVRERNGLLFFRYTAPDGSTFERSRNLRARGPVKVMQPRGVPLSMWWPNGREVGDRAVLLVEGESDALAALTAIQRRIGVDLQYDLVVAACPGTGFPPVRVRDELAALGVTAVELAFDTDDAGRRYTDAVAEVLDEAGASVSAFPLPDRLDLAEWLARTQDPGLFVALLFGPGAD